jgi:hypothetical protein
LVTCIWKARMPTKMEASMRIEKMLQLVFSNRSSFVLD